MPSIPQPLDPRDDGGVAPAVTAALSSYQAGTAGAGEVLAALSGARLLVPVVALLTESEVGAHGLRQEKESEMALPKLVGQDGRQAVLAFTGAEALARWRADARPIQATALQVCRAAVQEKAAAVVVDVAGPVQFVIEGEVLEALAAVDSGTVGELTGVTVARVEPVRGRRWFSRGKRRG
ncbi:SseB family protein [Nonomuraea jiangxiensis]|uniref:SseB protein N-terminal domain-containing protein n=1 Tax=Nonomuraea jiangxiensis TaxID=633440 RepID=A0A1G8CHM8_9ACTN|nr:SseB family protein [Nonomuraea jiangxiensis]SDH44902.1 SseB protein N-terminal domain-containing protein [Nonomuraea jiangxiensis]